MKMFFFFVVLIAEGCLPSRTSFQKAWYVYPIPEPYIVKHGYYKPLVKPSHVVEFCQVAIDLCWDRNRWTSNRELMEMTFNRDLQEMEKPTIDCRLPDNVALCARVAKKPPEPVIPVDDFEVREFNTDYIMRKFCDNYGVSVEFRRDKIILYCDP